MPKIEVRFQPESKVSKAGRDYQLIEMWVTNRDGGWSDRPTISMMPFHARLLLQNLPEFCEAIKSTEKLKEGFEEPQEESQIEGETENPPW
tara:strand:+ start:7864 stop:8136 length:273 start_codon:yes stop_codon:yes gene_type:complete